MRGVVLSIAWLLFAASPVFAASPEPSVRAVERALGELRYADAFSLASQALAQGGRGPEDVVALYRAEAICAAVLGQEDAAEHAFAAMLELSPGSRLPPDSSPKLLRPLDRARHHLNGARLTLDERSTMLVDGWVRSDVTVTGDALSLVHDLQLLPLDPPGAEPLDASGHQLSWRCARAPCPHLLQARDAVGNVLQTLGTTEAPLSVRPLPPAPVVIEQRSFWSRPLPYAIGGAVLAVTGGIFAWQLHDAEADLRAIEAARAEHTLADAQSADSRRHTTQVGMVASFGGALVLGTVAVVVW